MPQVSEVVSSLSRGFSWTDPKNQIKTLMQTWTEKLGPILDDQYLHVGDGCVRFVATFPKMRLRGVAEMPSLLLGSDGDDARGAVNQLLRDVSGGHNRGLILCLTEAAHSFVKGRNIPGDSSVLFSPSEVAAVLVDGNPLGRFKKYLRLRVGLYGLIPFLTSRPAEGAMFVGRSSELHMLVEEDQDFALCGDGGLGKSSLIRQVMLILRQRRHRRFKRVVEVELNACSRNLDAAVREIAKRISPSRVSHEACLDNFDAVLRHLKSSDTRFADGPIDLFLDETDAILGLDRESFEVEKGKDNEKKSDPFSYPLMRALRHARTQGLIRLTISGRGQTKILLDDPENPFAVNSVGGLHVSRIKLIELKKLDDSAAVDLLLGPLGELGFDIQMHRADMLRRLVDCHGVPFHIQNLGLDIAHEFAKQSLNSAS